jgi:hypothetical protein
MTHAISVPTPFNDINELAENFASRVDEERLMLPHYEAIPEGEWVQFEVTFSDGAPALSGVGKCASSQDYGEEREPEHRFDIEIDGLQLDEMASVYFERLLMARASLAPQQDAPPEEPAHAAEVPSVDDVSFDDMPSEPLAPAFEEPAAEDVQPAFADEPAEPEHEPAPPARHPSERAERLSAPAGAIYALPAPTAPGQLPSPHSNGSSLTRRLVDATWSPQPMERPERGASTGYFQYGTGVLPRPGEPPRPQIDASLRVARAPRPGDPHTGIAAAAAYAEEENAYGGDETVQADLPEDEEY